MKPLVFLGDRPLPVCEVGSARAVGLRNPNSSTNARAEVTAGLRQRTALTRAYNRESRRRAEVRDAFRRTDPSNHRLDETVAAMSWAHRLRPHL
jgi:hypothetical protein